MLAQDVILVGIGIAALWWGFGGADDDYALRERDRLDREALDLFPTREACMKALRREEPCGCLTDWSLSPPGKLQCEVHMIFGGSYSGIPDEVRQAWRSRDLLRQKGQW